MATTPGAETTLFGSNERMLLVNVRFPASGIFLDELEIASDDETSSVAIVVNAVPDPSEEASADGSTNQEPGASATDSEAEHLMSRLSGWQYEIPGYQKNLLIRRWDDLLKAP